MKHCYICDFCGQVFNSEGEAAQHEEICGYNPKNKIKDATLFRLAMIYESLPSIIACALYDVAESKLRWLYEEANRASTTNCFYVIFDHKQKMLRAIQKAEDVMRKHKGRNSCTYNDVAREYPELLKALTDTLNRAAWNERP